MRLTYSRQELRFASRIVRFTRARALLYAIRLAVVGERRKALSDRFLAEMAVAHWSDHHGTGMRRGRLLVRGMLPSAALRMASVIWFAREVAVECSSGLTVSIQEDEDLVARRLQGAAECAELGHELAEAQHAEDPQQAQHPQRALRVPPRRRPVLLRLGRARASSRPNASSSEASRSCVCR